MSTGAAAPAPEAADAIVSAAAPLLEPSAKPQAPRPTSGSILVATGVLGSLLNAGLAFGFSALLPVLIAQGAFHDSCPSTAALEEACPEQLSALNGMFTLATSALNMAALPAGAVLDRWGPRSTAVGALLTAAVGVALFGAGGAGQAGHIKYYGGFLMLGVAGPVMFNCTLSFGNISPPHRGLITSALVGSFDASSAVFLVLSILIDSGVPFAAVFSGYAAVPLLTAAAALVFWPSQALTEPAEDPDRAEENSLEVAPSPLAESSFGRQVPTLEFWLAAWTASVTMISINFFIGTSFRQLFAVQADTARGLTNVFSAFLPAGGIVYIPLIGLIVDVLGPVSGFLLLWCGVTLFFLLFALYAATGCATVVYVAFAVFALCRPLFYTLWASYCGQVFGFRTFGKVYGLMTTLSGAACLMVQPLSALTTARGFDFVRNLLLALHLTTVSLPLVLMRRAAARGDPRRQPSKILQGRGRRMTLQDRGRSLSNASAEAMIVRGTSMSKLSPLRDEGASRKAVTADAGI